MALDFCDFEEHGKHPELLSPSRQHLLRAHSQMPPDNRLASAKDWECFFDEWREYTRDQKPFTAKKDGGVLEDDVKAKFVVPLLRHLGWPFEEQHLELDMTLQVGSKPVDVRADIVLAPKPFATIPGHAYAVIELKRPHTNFEDAQKQARCYADHLRAPVYAVIDGTRIKIWKRRLVHEDELWLSITPEEFVEKWGTIGRHLGRKPLVALYDRSRLKPDSSSLHDIAHDLPEPSDSTLSISFRLTDNIIRTSLASDSIRNAELWWGTPEDVLRPKLRVNIAGRFVDWTRIAPHLVDVLTRLAAHSTGIRLQVDDPDQWSQQLTSVPLLLGDYHDSEASRELAELRSGDFDISQYELTDSPALAESLHALLDLWVTQSIGNILRNLRSQCVTDGRFAHWRNEEVLKKLEPHPQCPWTDQPSAELLRSMLRADRSDGPESRRRFGPRALDYLIDCILFARALARIIPHLVPSETFAFPHNLFITLQSPTQSLGSPKPFGFAYAMAGIRHRQSFASRDVSMFAPDTTLLALSCSSLRPEHVSPRRPIGAAGQEHLGRWLVGQAPDHGIVLCLSDDAKGILRDSSWDAFVQHIGNEIQRSLAPNNHND